MDSDPRGLLLFRRDYRRPSGGHLKVSHYLSHAEGSQRYRPAVYLVPGGDRGVDNPFAMDPAKIVVGWHPEAAAALFVAGLDWEAVPAQLGIPVINLVQGVRHADPEDPRRRFLERRAVRICVSPEVSQAILSTGLVNGPVVTIPNGIDIVDDSPLEGLPHRSADRPGGILIAGWKEPERTWRVAAILHGHGVALDVLDHAVPRAEFLGRLAMAATAVLLPLPREGCFLPALEAFALGCLVICPDCVGNRGFCRDGDTCLVPNGDPEAVAAATLRALALPDGDRRRIVDQAREEAAARRLDTERQTFLRLLDDLPTIW